MDDQQAAFVETFRKFMNELILVPRPQIEDRTPLGDVVQDFLQTDVSMLGHRGHCHAPTDRR